MVMISRLYPEVIRVCRPLIIEDEVLKLCAKKFAELIPRSITAEEAHRSPIKCEQTHIVNFPDGSERGEAFGLEMSGKIFRLVHAKFKGDRVYSLTTKLYEVPEQKLRGSGFAVISYVARCVANFVSIVCGPSREKVILGVSIGFPIRQESLQNASLLHWNGKFDCNDFIHEDFFEQLKLALKMHKSTRNLFLIAATHNAASSLISGMYKDPTSRIGLSIGDSIDVCYLEKQDNLSLYPGDGFRSRAAVSLDFRFFGDNGCLDFIKSDFDRHLDAGSSNPGMQTLDKLIFGQHLGEILRLCLLRLIADKVILGGALSPKLNVAGALQTEDIAAIEGEPEKQFHRCRDVLRRFGYINPSDEDCLQVRFAARCIIRRSANLLAAFLAALIAQINLREIRVCVDGWLIRQLPAYKDYLEKKLEKLKKPEFKVIIATNNREDLALGAGLLAFIYKDGVIRVEEKYRVLPPPRYPVGKDCSDCEAMESVISADSRQG